MILQMATIVDQAAALLGNADHPFIVRLAALECLHAFREVLGYPVQVMDVLARARKERDVERRDESVPPTMRSFYRGQWDDMLRDTWDCQTAEVRQLLVGLEEVERARAETQKPPPV